MVNETIIVNDMMRPDIFDDIKGVIFDCDGVIIDSLAANIWFYNHFREGFGFGPMNAEDEDYTHTHNLFESMMRIVGPEHYEGALQRKREFDYRRVLPHIRLEPFVEDYLQWLRGEDFRLGICTSRTDTLDLVLDHFSLTEFFFPTITSFKVRNAKPHPESVWAVLDAWRMAPKDVVYIGDSKVDEHTALNAGVRFWSYKNPMLQAELLVEDFLTLKNVMQRANSPFSW